MLIAQNVFQGFAVAYFRLQTSCQTIFRCGLLRIPVLSLGLRSSATGSDRSLQSH